MKFTPVDSSNINGIAFTTEDSLADTGTLTVRFNSGQEYDYLKFPAQMAEDFLGSESKGKFFHANIRGQFKGVKKEEVPEEPTESDCPICRAENIEIADAEGEGEKYLVDTDTGAGDLVVDDGEEREVDTSSLRVEAEGEKF